MDLNCVVNNIFLILLSKLGRQKLVAITSALCLQVDLGIRIFSTYKMDSLVAMQQLDTNITTYIYMQSTEL